MTIEEAIKVLRTENIELGGNAKDDNQTDWYGKDMVLTEEQAKQLADFVSDYCPYNCGTIENLVARSLMRGNKVVINADW